MKTRYCSICNSDKYYCRGMCKKCYMKSFVPSSWSKKYKKCTACGSDVSPHVGHGLCSKCYSKQSTELLCACGCGTPITKRGNKPRRYVKGHWLKSNGHSDLIRPDISGEKNPQFGKFGKEHPAYGHYTPETVRQARRERRLKSIATRGKTTGIERALSKILDSMNINHTPQTLLYGKFSVDEFLPDCNLVIEANGGYWHGDWRKFPEPNKVQANNQSRDASKYAYLTKCGHRVLVLWEKELITDASWCKREILLALENFLIPLVQDSVQVKSVSS